VSRSAQAHPADRDIAIETRHPSSPDHARAATTDELRARFLLSGLFVPDELRLVYLHQDRLVVGGAVPAGDPLTLRAEGPIGTGPFLARRELAIVNLGGPGSVELGDQRHRLGPAGCLYAGLGAPDPVLGSDDAERPARFYVVSAPAHAVHPTATTTRREAERVELGAPEEANERTLFKFVHSGGIASCQLQVGMTTIAPGSVWNTVPPHLHDRRSEVYLYFGLPPEARIVHLMGEPQATRHLIVADLEAVVSPPWSIHAGAGTAAYSFVWAMAGENADYADVDSVALTELS
jgi:4-deoxy-L-threo-5-hexosulose-uronate ketol-isomerase